MNFDDFKIGMTVEALKDCGRTIKRGDKGIIRDICEDPYKMGDNRGKCLVVHFLSRPPRNTEMKNRFGVEHYVWCFYKSKQIFNSWHYSSMKLVYSWKKL